MLVIAALSFLAWTMLATSAARLTISLENDCQSDRERLLSELLWTTAGRLREAPPIQKEDMEVDDGIAPEEPPLKRRKKSAEQVRSSENMLEPEQVRVLESTPFASCGPGSARRDLPLESIATKDEPVSLCAIGKLAKGGDFLRSEDGSMLAKLVSGPEATELKAWGREAIAGMPHYPDGGCESFRRTLLVETTLSFDLDSSTYIVMPNLTYFLEQASPDNWEVLAVYDAKPLPNLGKGLVNLFKDLTTGWGVDLPKLGTWSGWAEVQESLARDMRFLADRVVDFSLFVHVLSRKGMSDVDARVPDMFAPSKGCIVEPGSTIVICFRVLDYLTPFSRLRRIESISKSEKFHDYTGKFMKAFGCLNDVDEPPCANYKNLASISEALSVSKNMAKAVFIGTTAFREAYTCTHETPKLQYHEYIGEEQQAWKWGEYVDVPSAGRLVARDVEWFADDSASADWLQTIASPEVASSGASVADNIELAYTMSEVRGHSSHLMPKEYLANCINTVKSFSTEGYVKTRSTDMLNVLWEDGSKHVIVVRGLPKTKIPIVSHFINFSYSHYEHKETVSDGRLQNCFLKTAYMRCDPLERGGVYFNYKQHFGALEVLVMSAEEHSDDMKIYLEALETVGEIPAESEVRSGLY